MEKLIEFLINKKLEEEVYESSITGAFYYRTTSLNAYKVIDSEEIVILAESHELEELWSNDDKLMAYRLFENEAEYDEFIDECRDGFHYGDFNFTFNVFDGLERVDEEGVRDYINCKDLWERIED
ncbi:TPA: hypothetical protein NGS33_003391 [Vibrio parahaemolyticus]|uniref:hypothetical protein n=1 Tax=Vibrio parahaemolyticus TaxID=670 RepID=UPI0011246622|nr:hypothetical protein [Vibrio parahaemolyticus]TPA81865.1 hypothetical protein DXJ87_21855 [Vibrio parahaemolyticus]HCE1745690.1 hypothetical protein [Vibrio parahaemolyticus]